MSHWYRAKDPSLMLHLSLDRKSLLSICFGDVFVSTLSFRQMVLLMH